MGSGVAGGPSGMMKKSQKGTTVILAEVGIQKYYENHYGFQPPLARGQASRE